MAVLLEPVDEARAPTAVLPTARALLLSPMAVLKLPEAVESAPYAVS
jgi:hypothetical protein